MLIANLSLKIRVVVSSVVVSITLGCAPPFAFGQSAEATGLAVTSISLNTSSESPLANVFVMGNYAYVGGMSTGYQTEENIGVRIVDLSDPANPVLVGRIPLRTLGYREDHSHGDAVATHINSAAFEGNVAIVLNGVPDIFDRDTYPQPYGIWDVTDPANPTFLSILNLGRAPLANEGGDGGDRPYDSKAVVGHYFYSLYDNYPGSRGFRDKYNEDIRFAAVDISDPYLPAVVGTWEPDDNDIWLFGLSVNESGTRAYITGLYPPLYHIASTTGYLFVLNIEDPNRPTEIGRYVFPLRGVPSSPWIARATNDGQIVVLADGSWGERGTASVPLVGCGILHILDTSDLSSIREISSFSVRGSDGPACWRNMATDIAIRGNVVFSTWVRAGVRAIDISDPTNPIEVGQMQFGNKYIWDIALLGEDRVVVTPIWDSGLYVMSFTPPAKTTSAGDEFEAPERFLLTQNYPNPFNPSTTIQYEMAETAYARLTVFDVFGRTIAELLAGQIPAGRHSVVWDASNQTSGVYFYRLETEHFVETKSMFLAR